MNEVVVRAEGLTRRFGTFTAVDGVSFEIRWGEIFGFLGPNGAGKTTTLRMLLGLLTPSAGRAWVLGHDATREADRIRPRIGYVSQRFSLYPDLTVWETLHFYGAAYGLPPRRRAERGAALLAALGLSGHEGQLVRHLAGGWRQRLALAVALLHEPEIVFLDEPTAGMDPIARRAIWSMLYRLAEQGVTVFVTTHYMDEAEQCTRLALIYNGRLILQGAPSALKAQAGLEALLEVTASPLERALGLLRGWAAIRSVTLHGASLHVLPRDPSLSVEAVRAYLEAAGLEGVVVGRIPPSLEDVFLWAIERERESAGR